MVDVKDAKNYVWLGSKEFDFHQTNVLYRDYINGLIPIINTDKTTLVELIKLGNPHYDIDYMHVSMWYNNDTKDFHYHTFGFKGGYCGDFFWSPEHILEILLANNVLDTDIPDFIKHHKDFQQEFLDGNTTKYTISKNWPKYTHTITQLFSDLPDLI